MAESKKEALSSEELEQVAGGMELISPETGRSGWLADNGSSNTRQANAAVNIL